jgi:hypothetical protein
MSKIVSSVTVQSGAVLNTTGTGVINATEINGIVIPVGSGAGTSGLVPVTDGAGNAAWSVPSGGGGSGVISGQVLADFGFQSGLETDITTVTVTASWITSGTILVCSPAPLATADHDPDDYSVEGIVAYAENLIVGTSFDIRVKSCGDGEITWGKYYINYVGTA